MPSASYTRWASDRSDALDEIEAAHRIVGGPRPGRRYATQQINQAYAMLLSSQFQGCCRDLHSECIESFVPLGLSHEWQILLEAALRSNRKLDSGNPNPGNIGNDFSRFGIAFWDEVYAQDARNKGRREALELLMIWRNAIAHQDFSDRRLGRAVLGLQQVRSWRRACDALASTFDTVMSRHIAIVSGQRPW
jgi:hypothetical protein